MALSGESADEVFGGYPMFHDPAYVEADTFPWLGGAAVRMETTQRLLDPGLVGKLDLAGYLDDLYRTALAEVPELTGPAAENPHERRMREVCHLFLTRFLPNLLDRKDRMSMAVGLGLGVRVRVPFCDHRLVEYVFGTPWAHKTFDGREKSPLRAATADVLPQSVVQRVKSPYRSTQDPGYDQMLHDGFAALVTKCDAAVAPLLDAHAAESALNAPPTDAVFGGIRFTLEQILTLESFLTDYGVSVSI